MLEKLIELVDSKPKPIQVPSFLIPLVWIRAAVVCVCACPLVLAGEFYR